MKYDLTATQIKGPSKVAPLLKSLDLLAKQEDPSRFTTFADCCEQPVVATPDAAGAAVSGMAVRDVIVGITDTVGYNRYFGWYYGQFCRFWHDAGRGAYAPSRIADRRLRIWRRGGADPAHR